MYNTFHLEDSTRGRITARQWYSDMPDGVDQDEFRSVFFLRLCSEPSVLNPARSLYHVFSRMTDFYVLCAGKTSMSGS